VDKFVLSGGFPLRGSVPIGGSKNAALPIMAACLLGEGRSVLHGVPALRDVNTLLKILEHLGVRSERDGTTLTLEVTDESEITAPWEFVKEMRASVCVLGPLLARRRRARVSYPGGCVFGARPIDIHLKGLSALGARVGVEHGYVVAEAPRLTGAEIFLGGAFGPTVLGTANVAMAAVLAEGTTVIEQAACEPEVTDLLQFLVKMGARIKGIGTHHLEIKGVDRLHGAEHTVIPDRIEAGTFLAAGLITSGEVTVTGVRPDHLAAVLDKFRDAGASFSKTSSSVTLHPPRRIHACQATTLAYPGFPTDLQAQLMAVLCLADGISVITEKIYPDRFMHVAELTRLGARIHKEGPHAIVEGIDHLSGAPVMASDLRASAALVLAGLVAHGQTEVHRVYHIDRGYERIEERLARLGARIRRVDEKTEKAEAEKA